MINRIKLFFDKNVFHRIITGILFIVPFILFILNGGYLFIFYFLLVLSILIEEFNAEAINKINSKSVLNLYIIGDFFCKNRFFFFSFFKTLNIFMDSDLKQGLGGYL